MAPAGQRAAAERDGRRGQMMLTGESIADPADQAERWIRTYDDLDAYVAECDGEEKWWIPEMLRGFVNMPICCK